jgi:coenzyme F420 biosynthesis associated uncharacterized protein
MTTTAPVDLLVDWDLAARTAARVAGAGPALPAGEAAQAVADLRRAAAAAVPHIARVSGLQVSADAHRLSVVDRRGWAVANGEAFRSLLEPVVAEVFRRRGEKLPSSSLAAVGSRISGAELGSLLGFLGSRVLGQYDPFATPGRLLIVAPNVVAAERDLAVDPDDFRLWVCLHEETHRVQFGATPWLADHLLAGVRGMAADLLVDPGQLAARLAAAARTLPDLVRGRREPGVTGSPLLDAVQTPEQRHRLAELAAVMSLLEGHADVMMDEVGPQVVPSVATIRSRFTERRAGRGALDRLLRRLLGMDGKMRQYADGARFVREVVAKVGVESFNAVWIEPGHLPRPEEIADPTAWVRRVHG